MTGSRATHSAIARKAALVVAGVVPTTVNQRNTPHPPSGKTNLDTEVPSHPNLILIPHRTRTIQTLYCEVPTFFPIERPEMLHDFSFLELNPGAQGTNELLNGIYDIVQQ